jgi:cytochrome c peroxidase
VSCASCHPAANGFASAEPLPKGIDERRAARHAPALWNRGFGTLQRWDGGAVSLDACVLEPIADANEMGSSVDEALLRLAADAEYSRQFEAAFASPPTREALQRSLATFVRGIVAGDAPYDRFLAGQADAMTALQRHGQWIFESKGACWKCHTPPLFTDERFHNTGVSVLDGKPELGRAAVTNDDHDKGRFKTPTLRGVRLTAPFMHDGSIDSLEAVVDFYERGGNDNPQLDGKLKQLELTAEDKRALVAFLRSL